MRKNGAVVWVDITWMLHEMFLTRLLDKSYVPDFSWIMWWLQILDHYILRVMFSFTPKPVICRHLLRSQDICLSLFRWSMLLSKTTGCLHLWTAPVPCTSSCSIAGRRTAIIVPNSARLLTTWTRWFVTPTCWRPWHLFLQGKTISDHLHVRHEHCSAVLDIVTV